jgi:dTDP-4-amino-4,6-dideoxygalactose transaminase
MRKLSSNHLYVLKIDFKKIGKTRAILMKEFEKSEIITQVHYIPVVSHPYFKKRKYQNNDFPNSFNYYDGALSIPLFYDLTDKQQSHVISQVKRLIG